jgi:hypothetical protein
VSSAFAIQRADNFSSETDDNNNINDVTADSEELAQHDSDSTTASLEPDDVKSHKHKRKIGTSSAQQQLSFSNANFNTIPLTPRRLLGSFEESLLNGRLNPVGIVDGFYAEIGASGSFFPEHATLPVNTAFYQVCEDVAASPYLGVLSLGSLGKRGYKVPNKGTIQVVSFFFSTQFV